MNHEKRHFNRIIFVADFRKIWYRRYQKVNKSEHFFPARSAGSAQRSDQGSDLPSAKNFYNQNFKISSA